jgi:YegS/Rv2252/BmrU family lipid kinase
MVIAAGGDGTLNEVVNGFFDDDQADAAREGVCLGVLPLGTGADFSRTLGTRKLEAAIRAVAEGVTVQVDAGRAEYRGADGRPARRYFVVAADLGIGAQVADLVNHSPKAFGPFATYLIGAVRGIFRYQPQEVTQRLDNGSSITGSAGLIVVANNSVFGGGMRIVPDARIDDGILDVVRLGGASRRQMLFDLLPKLYRGRHLTHPAVRHDRARVVSIESDTPFPIEIDGDVVGTTPALFTALPGALRVVVDDKHWAGRSGYSEQRQGMGA